ncbi:MAG TPA: hypothetical protein VMR49_03000 [Candidatus Paceibacterota bacterium]|nr:hypothetical protein [Candidatus Paceibacterota bacterium]
METKKALLVTEIYRFNQRSLYEMEGTRDGRFYSNGVSGLIIQSVRVRPATNELLKSELVRLGIIIDDIPTIKKVANRFISDLSTMKEGKLAYYYGDPDNRLLEIVEIIKEEVR